MIKKVNVNKNRIIEQAIERDPVVILGRNYKVKIVYRNVSVVELDVDSKVIKISLPNKYKKMDSSEILDLAIEKLYEQIAKVEIERAMEKTRIILGFAPEEYEIKKIKKLAECKNSKITISPEVSIYSREVIDYIVLHEYCHLKYKTHCKEFNKLIEKNCANYKKCEEILMKI